MGVHEIILSHDIFSIEKLETNFTLQADSARRIDQFVIPLKANTKNSLNVRYSFLIFSIPATDIEIIIRYSYSFCWVLTFCSSSFPSQIQAEDK